MLNALMNLDQITMIALFQLGVVLFIFAAVVAYTRTTTPLVLTLHKDPPPDAAYIRLMQEMAEDEREREMERIKTDQVLHIAFYYNGGKCSAAPLWETIKANWNAHYSSPEFKEWRISRNFMLSALSTLDYETSGRVIEVAPDNDSGVAAGSYILTDLGMAGNRNLGRSLIRVDELVEAFKRERGINTSQPPEAAAAVVVDSAEEAATVVPSKEGEAVTTVSPPAVPDWLDNLTKPQSLETAGAF